MERIWRFPILLVLLQQAFSPAEATDGEWGEWSPCSRSCGPAISVQQRNCSIDTCGEGQRMQFRSCPNSPCEEETDLRMELCATFSEGNLTYYPLNNEDQCLLTCKATLPDGQMVVQGPLQALPGSHCTTASGDEGICVNSLCTPVGCDGIVGSRKTVDKCGRCSYDKVCTPNSGTRTREPTTGHVEMMVLPAGVSSITVTNLLPPHLASLMVRSETGDFLFSVGPPGHKFEAGGTVFVYRVESDEGNFTESLMTNGTLNHSVTIELYIPSRRVAPSINYEYHTLEYLGPWGQNGAGGPLVTTTNSIGWVYGHFLPCTETCATGVQVAYALCKDLDFNRVLPDIYCSSDKPTPILQHCGSGNCAPRWVTREWLPCSETRCGVGSQHRLVQCMVLEANGRDTMVGNDRCNTSSKPRQERECVVTETSGCGTEWEKEEWGECCSQEPLVRRVECVDSLGRPQPAFYCSHLQRNSSLRVCERGPCTNGGCSWVPKRWFSCNNTCGRGQQRRNVRCRNSENKAAAPYCCRDQPLPELQRGCHDDRATWCRPLWYTGTWEQCRGECGGEQGERTRSVYCWAEDRHNPHYIDFPHDFCSNQSQPVSRENCTRSDPLCSDCSWDTSQWSECFCPVGVRIRTVTCSSGVGECCLQRQPHKPPDGERCACPTTDPPQPTTPTQEPCSDYQDVNCRQLKEDGYCAESDTDFFKLLCCQTCSQTH